MRSRRLVFTDPAETDLAELAAYWIAGSPDRARQFLVRFRLALADHAAKGLTGSPIHHIAPGTRGFFFGRYVAVLRTTDTSLEVLRVFPTARNIAALISDST